MENIEGMRREMYFIISKKQSKISSDFEALTMVNELHHSRGIDNLFLNPEEFYAVSKYCDNNSIKKIKLDEISDAHNILKNIRNAPNNFRIFAYVRADEEDLEWLRNSLRKYYDFNVEKRIRED